ncbi:MAG: phosphoribosylamine--glycine ligase [Anaerolineales bacterium]|nr:phosphoribosylamine--glycine ligase [Anaerolineales bacterium]
MPEKALKVLVLGYGSREHALTWKLSQSPLVGQLYVAPGNAGTAEIATNVPISDEDIPALVEFAVAEGIDLTVVGTNDPLALGAADAFMARGLRIFGPTQAAARLESSKAFAKEFMQAQGIPTPAFATFNDYESAERYLDNLPSEKVVVKVSGLGRMGMGVTVCDSKEEARAALYDYMVIRSLGEAAETVIIEERLSGPELSVFALSDGETVVPLLPVRDHKRIFDGDRGPNTGGIGAYAPPPDVPAGLVEQVTETILRPVVRGMAEAGTPYVGVLFAGLMLTEQGVQVLEFNCRFGNPEALVLLTQLESDFAELLLACISGQLRPEMVRFHPGAAAAVVMTSPGYPKEGFPRGLPISGLDVAAEQPGIALFHHGTRRLDGQLVTARGRVLAVTASAPDLPTALHRAYAGVSKIHFEGAHYRRDIGRNVITPTTEMRQAQADLMPGKQVQGKAL